MLIDSGTTTLALFAAAGAAALTTSVLKLKSRLALSRAKHRSVGGHARLSRRLAGLISFYAYDESQIFRSDDPPEEIATARHAGFMRLAKLYAERYPQTMRLTADAKAGISDLQFTDTYRVPFQFRELVQRHLSAPAFVQSSQGVMLTDLDGNRFYDLTGSYGVNLLGYDFYKGSIARAVERAGELGPVLGSYHPVVADNVARLRAISGLDEVSFHMSGTEAVMQAVRLARYHTRRPHPGAFCGAYHRW